MASKKNRNWTETELKYFCLVLADKELEYAHQLDSLALKKSANRKIFEDLKAKLEEHFQSEEFKVENEQEKRKLKSKYKDVALDISPEKLRTKFKWIKEQWKKFTDRVKTASGKAPINEPEWYHIINPILSDTQGSLVPCTKSSDVLGEWERDSDKSDTETSIDEVEAEVNVEGDESDNGETESTESCSDSSGKRKLPKKILDVKPLIKKTRVKSQTQAIHEIAKSFSSLGEAQQKRSDTLLQAEKERQAEFLQFQREQAELNRQHELKMLEIIMKFGNNSGSALQDQPQYYSTPPVYSHSAPPPAPLPSGFPQYDQAGRSQGEGDILNMDSHQPAWY